MREGDPPTPLGEGVGGGDAVLSRLLPLYVVIFAGFVGYSLMITVFTPLLLSPDGFMLAAGTSASTRALLLGGLLALYPLGQFVGSPVMGSLSDRYGRRKVLLVSLSATTACYAVIVLALWRGSLGLLAAACLAGGAAEANIVCAQGAIADIAPAAERERYFGYIYLSASLAYVIGPLVGGKLAFWFGAPVPFALVLLLLIGVAVAIARRFHEARVASPGARSASPLTALSVVLDPRLRRMFLVNFLLYVAIFGFFRSYPMYLAQAFHLGVSRISEFIAWVGVPIVLVNLGVTGAVAKRVSARALTLVAGSATAVLVAAVVVPPSTLGLWPVLFLASAALALTLPACATMLSESAGPEEQGRVMGGNQAMQVGAEALSGALAGVLAAIAIVLPLPILGLVALLGVMTLGAAPSADRRSRPALRVARRGGRPG